MLYKKYLFTFLGLFSCSIASAEIENRYEHFVKQFEKANNEISLDDFTTGFGEKDKFGKHCRETRETIPEVLLETSFTKILVNKVAGRDDGPQFPKEPAKKVWKLDYRTLGQRSSSIAETMTTENYLGKELIFFLPENLYTTNDGIGEIRGPIKVRVRRNADQILFKGFFTAYTPLAPSRPPRPVGLAGYCWLEK